MPVVNWVIIFIELPGGFLFSPFGCLIGGTWALRMSRIVQPHTWGKGWTCQGFSHGQEVLPVRLAGRVSRQCSGHVSPSSDVFIAIFTSGA